MGKRLSIRVNPFYFLVSACCIMVPAEAWSHVKWFYPYDLSQPPLPVGDVLTAGFIQLYLLSILGIYAFFLFDRFLLRRRFLATILEKYSVDPQGSFWFLRISVFVFFVSLFLFALDGGGFY